jgi:hypothetical protein
MASCSDAGRASGRIAQFSSVLLAYPSTRDFPLDPGTKALLSQVELLGRVRPYAEMRAAVLVSIRRRVRFMSRLASAWTGPGRGNLSTADPQHFADFIRECVSGRSISSFRINQFYHARKKPSAQSSVVRCSFLSFEGCPQWSDIRISACAFTRANMGLFKEGT